MQKELLKMKKELADILAANSALRQAVYEVNKIEIMRGSLIARNPRHLDVRIGEILDGALQKDVTVGDYMFIQNAIKLVQAAYNNLEMGNSVDRTLLIAAYRILSEKPTGGFRNNNPVVYSFNHVPPHCSDIDEKIGNSFRRIYGGSMADDVIAKAMYMHNSIIDIWPFDEYNGELAVFAMNYYLMEQGLMPIDMPIGRQDYQDLVAASLKGMRPDEEYSFFRDAVMEKMAKTIDACRSYI